MKMSERIPFYICWVMFFGMFWAFGTVATGVTSELTGLDEIIRANIPNFSLVEGWLTATGGTLISLGMLKWMGFSKMPRSSVAPPPPTKKQLPTATVLEFKRKV